MIAGKEALLKAAQRRYTTVDIEGVGSFRIQSLNGRELTEFVAKFQQTNGQVETGNVDSLARLIALCLVDESGHRLFSSDEEQQLVDLEFGVLVELANACQEHNKLTDKQQDKLAKN